MQISLRSQLVAGTTALVGATAIAMTPIAPAVSLPSLNVSKAAVALAAIDNPITALINTGGLAIDYLINGQYQLGAGGGAANWGAGMGTNSGIGDIVNGLIYNSYIPSPGPGYLPNITNVGLVPNFLSAPFPVLTQVVNNWLGYAGVVVDTGAQVLGDLSSLLWAPVGITVAIASAVLSGNFSQIPVIIQEGIQTAIGGVTDAIQATIAGAQYILASVVAKAQALITNVTTALPTLLTTIQGQAAALVASVTANVQAITTAIAGGDITNIWNTTVASLLSPLGIPGTLLNLTLGAGVQLTADPTTYVPSVRATIQTLGQSVKGALGTAPAAAAAVRAPRAAAAVAAPAAPVAAVAAASTEAASSDAAAAPAKKAGVGRHAAAARAAAAK